MIIARNEFEIIDIFSLIFDSFWNLDFCVLCSSLIRFEFVEEKYDWTSKSNDFLGFISFHLRNVVTAALNINLLVKAKSNESISNSLFYFTFLFIVKWSNINNKRPPFQSFSSKRNFEETKQERTATMTKVFLFVLAWELKWIIRRKWSVNIELVRLESIEEEIKSRLVECVIDW